MHELLFVHCINGGFSMRINIAMYLKDVRNIDAMFEAFDLKETELDSEVIEETLADWEQFISVLRDRGVHDLADEVYEKIEEIEDRLAIYEQEQIKAEEQAVVDDASDRLTQSAVDNLLAHAIKTKKQQADIGLEHKAEFRLRNRDKDFPKRLNRLIDKA